MVAAFGRWLHHPNLWHLNRRSVSGAVAIGSFSGLVPGPLQMLTALLRDSAEEEPAGGAADHLYTNPFTIVPLYLLARRTAAHARSASRRAAVRFRLEQYFGVR